MIVGLILLSTVVMVGVATIATIKALVSFLRG
jgi:hypothetical protein